MYIQIKRKNTGSYESSCNNICCENMKRALEQGNLVTNDKGKLGFLVFKTALTHSSHIDIKNCPFCGIEIFYNK